MADMQPHGKERSFRGNIKSLKHQKKEKKPYLTNIQRQTTEEKNEMLHLSESGLEKPGRVTGFWRPWKECIHDRDAEEKGHSSLKG